jgi:hypothetical protein
MIRHLPFLEVINVWTPLGNVHLRPLGLMTLPTTNASDLLRYRTNSTKNAGGRQGSFASDRLMPLHNAAQEWWWDSRMQLGHAMLFLTGKTAHTSFSLAGEEGEMNEQVTALRAYIATGPASNAFTSICSRSGALVARSQAATLDDLGAPANPDPTPPQTAALLQMLAATTHLLCTDSTSHSHKDDAMAVNAANSADIESQNRKRAATAVLEATRESLEIRCAALVVTPTHAGSVLYMTVLAVGCARFLKQGW